MAPRTSRGPRSVIHSECPGPENLLDGGVGLYEPEEAQSAIRSAGDMAPGSDPPTLRVPGTLSPVEPLARPAGEGDVEVDDAEAVRVGHREPLRHLPGGAVVDLCALAAPLLEAHGRAAHEIDHREDLHSFRGLVNPARLLASRAMRGLGLA